MHALAIVLAAGMLQTSATAAARTCDFVLEEANIWTGEDFDRRNLAVVNGHFEEPGDAHDALPRIAARYSYLIPPLADAHNHNVDQPSPRTAETHREYVREGIFYLLNPNNILLEDAHGLPGAHEVDAVYAGGGITGPGGHPRPLYETLARIGWLDRIKLEDLPGRAFHEVSTPEQTHMAVDRIAATGTSVVKLYLLDHASPESKGLTPQLLRAAIARARTQRLRPIVHVATAADFRLAAEAGAAAAMHMPGHLPREGYAPEDYLITPADARLAKEAGMAVVPSIAVAFNAFAGEPLRAAQDIQYRNLRTLRDAGVSILAGADRPGADAIDELALLRASGVFDTAELLNIATTQTAQFIHPERKIGELRPGFEASFLVTAADPRRMWYFLSKPPVGVRSGEILFDELGLFADACGDDKSDP